MSDTYGKDLSDFATWDEQALGKFFRIRGLGAYEPLLIQHKITGRLAPLLTDEDLKEIGINIVGDRLLFKMCLKEMSRKHRFHKRIESLWEGEEKLFFSDCEKSCFTCGGFCPVDPGHYKLTTNHLKVKRMKPVRCGPIPLCCFGVTYTSNNIDLSKVDDVDVVRNKSSLWLPMSCWNSRFFSLLLCILFMLFIRRAFRHPARNACVAAHAALIRLR